MRDALYINGVYDGVLQEIVTVQSAVPEQVLFLQPYSDSQISMLAKLPPTTDDPVQLYVSTTDDLTHVRYYGEVVGWENKVTIAPARKSIFERLIKEFQPGEKNLYEKGVNVVIVRRLVELPKPFPVRQLTVRSTNAPHGERATAGGWSFVLPNPEGVTLPPVGALPPPKSSKKDSAFDTIPKAE